MTWQVFYEERSLSCIGQFKNSWHKKINLVKYYCDSANERLLTEHEWLRWIKKKKKRIKQQTTWHEIKERLSVLYTTDIFKTSHSRAKKTSQKSLHAWSYLWAYNLFWHYHVRIAKSSGFCCCWYESLLEENVKYISKEKHKISAYYSHCTTI